MTTTRQRILPFDVYYADAREQARRARVEKLMGKHPNITTGAKMFDERTYREATRLAQQPPHHTNEVAP